MYPTGLSEIAGVDDQDQVIRRILAHFLPERTRDERAAHLVDDEVISHTLQGAMPDIPVISKPVTSIVKHDDISILEVMFWRHRLWQTASGADISERFTDPQNLCLTSPNLEPIQHHIGVNHLFRWNVPQRF